MIYDMTDILIQYNILTIIYTVVIIETLQVNTNHLVTTPNPDIFIPDQEPRSNNYSSVFFLVSLSLPNPLFTSFSPLLFSS